MKNAVIFGAGYVGKMVYEKIKDIYCVLYATDNDERKYGTELVSNVPILDKSELFNGDFDYVVIASYAGYEEIHKQLIEEFNLDESVIVSKFVEYAIAAKKQFLESYAKIVYSKGIPGDVCEVGVYRGEFAKWINKAFPDRTCYLFDTFGGYDARDIAVETANGRSHITIGHHSMTSEKLVLSKMPYHGLCAIKKGYFPETFDLYETVFCFVNLDTDLYSPTIAGLELFYPRMTKGGAIVIHDYFFDFAGGASVAVDEFVKGNNLRIMPIGDGISVVIVKN
jgi:O-methyltransferase